MVPHSVQTIDKIQSCVDKIEDSLNRREEMNGNGDFTETVDTEEVEKWQNNSSNGSSGKLKGV